MGLPRANSDNGAWTADGKVVAFTPAYIRPEGQHAFYNPAPCQGWDNATYLANLGLNELAHVLRGSNSIPMLDRRVEHLNEVGEWFQRGRRW